MSTRTTFEDRLLGELKREIELREAGTCEAGAAEAGTGGGKATAFLRRLFTPRRIAVVAVACAVAGLAPVVVPGSPAEKAYAVEPRDDGSVKIIIKDRDIDFEEQQELAKDVSRWDIQVDVVAPDDTCTGWGDPAVLELSAITKQGDPVPVRTWFTLRRGSTLVFENTWGKPVTRDEIKHYEVEPCDPAKPATPDD